MNLHETSMALSYICYCTRERWWSPMAIGFVQNVYLLKMIEEIFCELIYVAEVIKKSWQELDWNSHLRISAQLLFQLSYRVNWEQYSRFIHLNSTKYSRDNLTFDICEDMHCFGSISESSLRWLQQCRLIHEIFSLCYPEDDSES